MAPEFLKTCPVCRHDLTAVRLECGHCGTGIDGHFPTSRFRGLTDEQLEFVEVFMRNRGIIRDVEAELGVSYPTVRSMLDNVVDAMEARTRPAPAPNPAKSEVLRKLSAGEISVDDAFRSLGSR